MTADRFVEFIETDLFQETAAEVPVTDEELRSLQETLIEDPESGAQVAGTGGVRKIRVGVKGKGKRGGARVIYYHVRQRQVIYLLVAYDKSEAGNLSAAGKKLMRQLTKEFDEE